MPRKLARVPLQVKTPRELLARWYPNGRLGGLRMEGPAPGVVGARLRLCVVLGEGSRSELEVQVQLSWARHRGSSNLPESYGLDFVPEDEPGRARLLAVAEEQVPVSATRHAPRITAELPVKISHQGKVRREKVVDLSEGGAFIRTQRPLPLGAELTFDLRPPRSLRSIRLKGKVAWVRDDGTEQGMGVEFVPDTEAQSARLSKLLGRLTEDASRPSS